MGKKTVTMSEDDLYHLHETIRRVKQCNVLLFELLDQTLAANARLAKHLNEALPNIFVADQAQQKLESIMRLYKPQEEESEKETVIDPAVDRHIRPSFRTEHSGAGS